MEILLFSLPIAILAFVFESYPRFLNRRFGVDIWTHLLYLKEYHRQGGIPKRIEDGFLVPGTYDYPPVFISILSKLPFRMIEKYDFLFSPFFDFLHIIFIFFVSYFLSGNILLAVCTQLLYALTPIIILENSIATPRSMGYTLFSLLIFSLFMFLQTNYLAFYFISFAAGTLIFLSHRFTTQGYLFLMIFFIIFERNSTYLLIFLLSFITAIVISRGFYIKVLKGHIGNLLFWNKNIDYRYAHQVKGNYKDYKTQDFIFRLYNQFLKFPPFVITITNPWTIFPIYILLFEFPKDLMLQRYLLLAVFFYILATLTIWIPKLRFLGEGQRYLELAAFPSAFFSALFLFNKISSDIGLFLAIIYILIAFAALITILVIQRKAIIKDSLRSVTPSMLEMFKYLKLQKTKPKLLCIPHQLTTNTIYHTGCKVFVNASYADSDKISDIYPYIKIPLLEVMKKYDLDLILMNEDYAKIEDLKLKKYKIVKRSGDFILIKI